VAQDGEGNRVATTYERVRAIVADRLGVDEDAVTMESEFIGDLNADSLDLVEVIMAMEQEFDLEIKDEDAENIRTMADAVQYIDEHGG
jgi:acyl carrier protein